MPSNRKPDSPDEELDAELAKAIGNQQQRRLDAEKARRRLTKRPKSRKADDGPERESKKT